MPSAPTDWSSALLVVLVGLVAGAAVLFVLRRRRAATTDASAASVLAVRDLEARRDALYAQIRELDATAAVRPEETVAEERRSLEMEAARVLKALDETTRGSKKAKDSRTEAPPTAPRTAAAGFLWGVLSTAAVGGLLFFVAQGAKPRPEGEPMTGSIRPEGESTQGGSDQLGALRAAVEKDPQNVEARLALVRGLVANRDFIGVYEHTDAVLKISPDHPEALSYQALVRIAMGQAEIARDMLQQALRGDPNLVNGYLHLALAQVRLGKVDEANATIDEAARRFPAEADLFRRAFEQMKSQGTETASAEGDANPHAESSPARTAAAPPAATGAAPGAAAAPIAATGAATAPSGGARIGGVIELDPSVAGSVSRGAIVFIAVREAGMDKGPPAAVKRLSADAFPLRFSITDADSMAGESLPSSVRVDVRVDSDGNAATREPNDPKAAVDDVAVGRTDLRLMLKR